MMSVSVSTLLVLFVLTILHKGAEGLSCYVCSSDVRGQEGCYDPFNYTAGRLVGGVRFCDHILPPPVSPYYSQYCKKIVIRRQHNKIIQRSCAWGPVNDARQYICGTSFGQEEFCDICGHDGCNGSSMHGPSFFVASVVPVILWYLFRS